MNESAEDIGDIERFFALLAQAVDAGTLVKLVLSRHHGEPADLQRIDARPLLLRGAPALGLTYHHSTRDVARNLAPDEALPLLRTLVGASGFRSAHLLTTGQDAELMLSKRGRAALRLGAAERTAVPTQAHDRAKQRHVELTRPFLTALGVTTPQHTLVPAMARKWKQIDKFVEVFSAAFAASPLASGTEPLSVVDFGSGKGYLTFAVHDHLTHTRAHSAQVTGIELRPDMVKLGNDAAAALGLKGLSFEQGDISRHGSGALDAMDVMIALHACDTATDHALNLGIRAGASVLMCSPCCHKQ
ncbi:MAG: class I SAM-dependent methyltransferase, partial [Polaromonas sp.]